MGARGGESIVSFKNKDVFFSVVSMWGSSLLIEYKLKQLRKNLKPVSEMQSLHLSYLLSPHCPQIAELVVKLGTLSTTALLLQLRTLEVRAVPSPSPQLSPLPFSTWQPDPCLQSKCLTISTAA